MGVYIRLRTVWLIERLRKIRKTLLFRFFLHDHPSIRTLLSSGYKETTSQKNIFWLPLGEIQKTSPSYYKPLQKGTRNISGSFSGFHRFFPFKLFNMLRWNIYGDMLWIPSQWQLFQDGRLKHWRSYLPEFSLTVPRLGGTCDSQRMCEKSKNKSFKECLHFF